jgi:hypothetical protein
MAQLVVLPLAHLLQPPQLISDALQCPQSTHLNVKQHNKRSLNRYVQNLTTCNSYYAHLFTADVTACDRLDFANSSCLSLEPGVVQFHQEQPLQRDRCASNLTETTPNQHGLPKCLEFSGGLIACSIHTTQRQPLTNTSHHTSYRTVVSYKPTPCNGTYVHHVFIQHAEPKPLPHALERNTARHYNESTASTPTHRHIITCIFLAAPVWRIRCLFRARNLRITRCSNEADASTFATWTRTM